MKIRLMFAGVLLASAAHASGYTGTLQKVQTSASPTTSGNTRTSINTGNVTSCTGTYAGWYSFDLPSASVGSVWLATLLAAITTNNQVVIVGTGTCDAYGLEIVEYIIALPPA